MPAPGTAFAPRSRSQPAGGGIKYSVQVSDGLISGLIGVD